MDAFYGDEEFILLMLSEKKKRSTSFHYKIGLETYSFISSQKSRNSISARSQTYFRMSVGKLDSLTQQFASHHAFWLKILNQHVEKLFSRMRCLKTLRNYELPQVFRTTKRRVLHKNVEHRRSKCFVIKTKIHEAPTTIRDPGDYMHLVSLDDLDCPQFTIFKCVPEIDMRDFFLFVCDSNLS